MERLNIMVMLGGPSAEREVSLRSGAAVARALRSAGHEVQELDPTNLSWAISPRTEVVFLALHGTYGEDGTVQQRLEEMKIPYTGSGPAASRLAFDKVATKKRFLEAGLVTARYEVIRSPLAAWPSGWSPPIVLKPARQGSSVGLQIIDDVEQWTPALAGGFQFDNQILLEEKIEGREVTVGILDDEALPLVEVRPRSGAYDYGNKYTAGATEYLCPAPFDLTATTRIQEAGRAAFRAVGARDYGRVDLIIRPDGQPVLLEVNTLPGMTETSLLPKAAAARGFSFVQLCEKMVELALSRDRSAALSGQGAVPLSGSSPAGRSTHVV